MYVALLDNLDIHRVLLFVRTSQVHLSNLFDPSGPVLRALLSRSDHALLFDLEYLAFRGRHLGREILCRPVVATQRTQRNKDVRTKLKERKKRRAAVFTTYSGTLRTREASKSDRTLLPDWALGTRWTRPSHLTPYTFITLLRFDHTRRDHRRRSRLSLRTSRARNTIFPLFESRN